MRGEKMVISFSSFINKKTKNYVWFFFLNLAFFALFFGCFSGVFRLENQIEFCTENDNQKSIKEKKN